MGKGMHFGEAISHLGSRSRIKTFYIWSCSAFLSVQDSQLFVQKISPSSSYALIFHFDVPLEPNFKPKSSGRWRRYDWIAQKPSRITGQQKWQQRRMQQGGTYNLTSHSYSNLNSSVFFFSLTKENSYCSFFVECEMKLLSDLRFRL